MSTSSNTMDFRRLWREMKNLKWIYLATFILIGGAAIWYVGRKLPTVPITGALLVGESNMDEASNATSLAPRGAAGLGQIMKSFSVGGFGGSSVDNEMYVLGSHEVMLRTVKLLNLNRSYFGTTRKDGKRAMLFRDMPVAVAAPAEFFDTLAYSFRLYIDLNTDGTVDVKATKGLFRRKIGEARNLQLPGKVSTRYGDIQIVKTESFAETPYSSVMAVVMGNRTAANALYKEVKIDAPSKLADVISVSLDYANKELGEAIVNTIMAQYNGRRLERIHETARNTIDYYDARIAEAFKNLQSAENKAADYQRDNTLVSPASQLPLLSAQNFKQREEAIEARNTLDYYRKVLSTLQNNAEPSMIPEVEAMGDRNVGAYNEMVARMRKLRRSAKDGNPAVSKLQEEISVMRNLIIENARKSIAKAETDIKLMESQAGKAGSQMGRFSSLAKEYSSLERDKEFQNSLYAFLVQARENAVLKLSTNTDVSFVYQPAYAAKESFPVKKVLLILGVFIFLFVSVTLLAYIVMAYKNSVTQPMDLASLGLEPRSAGGKGATDAMDHMRTMLMADPEARIIYCADLTGRGEIAGEVARSIGRTDTPVVEISPESNSRLLSPAMQATLKDSAATDTYVIVSIPDADKLFEIENAVDRPEAKLLVALPEGISRSKVQNILKGQSVDKIYTYIA